MSKQLLPLAIAAMLILLGTLYQGKHTERWGDQNSVLLDQFTVNLPKLPTKIAGWTSIETPISDEEFQRTNCTAFVSRVYTNPKSNDEVSVYSVVGIARHVTIHSPDWCYVGAGFVMEGDPQPYIIQIDGQDHEFTTATFRKQETDGMKRLRIFWSYTEDGQWLAPSWPKSHFAGRPALCKVYLITSINERETVGTSPSIEFAKELIPALNTELFRPAATTKSEAGADSETNFLNDLDFS